LRLAKCTGHVNLAETCLPSELAEERQQGLLLPPVRREARTALFHSASSIEAL
jgi:hypothetical protein